MDLLKGQKLINQKGEYILFDKLLENIKVLLMYYSASWSEPCKKFLPKLQLVYEESKHTSMSLEIIYISSDKEEADMMRHFHEKMGDWYAISFGGYVRQELQLFHNITAVPVLIVLKKDGTVVTKSGVKEVEELGKVVLGTWL